MFDIVSALCMFVSVDHQNECFFLLMSLSLCLLCLCWLIWFMFMVVCDLSLPFVCLSLSSITLCIYVCAGRPSTCFFIRHLPSPRTTPATFPTGISTKKRLFGSSKTVAQTFLNLRNVLFLRPIHTPHKKIHDPPYNPLPPKIIDLPGFTQDLGKRLISVSPIERHNYGVPNRPAYETSTVFRPGGAGFSLRRVQDMLK